MTQTQDFSTESRTFTWATPGQGDLGALLELDGFGQLEAMVTGAMPPPPIMATLGFTGFHGGVISTLLDTAAGCAVHSTLAVGEMYTSLDLTVKFLRPVTVDSGLLTCEGTVLQRGRRTALAQAQLTDERGKLVAHATSSCLIFPPQG